MSRNLLSRLGRRGQSLLEFTFVGIPMIFILIGTFEISRGMWVYHTLAYSAKAGVRFASVHGENCAPPNLNTCTQTIAQLAQVIQDAGISLDIAKTDVSFITLNGDGTVNATVTCKLRAGCQSNNNVWPPQDGSNQKGKLIRIDVKTPFVSAISLLWPGAGGVRFASGTLGASSSDTIQF